MAEENRKLFFFSLGYILSKLCQSNSSFLSSKTIHKLEKKEIFLEYKIRSYLIELAEVLYFKRKR